MSSVIYLLRTSLRTISTSLYQDLGSVLVISMEDTSLPAKVVKTTPQYTLTEGEQLSYEQLLGLLVKADKVVTL